MKHLFKLFRLIKQISLYKIYKINNCRAKNHINQQLVLISSYVLSDWEKERAGRTIRVVSNKYCCSNCKTTFIKKEWEGKAIEDLYN